MIRAHVDKVVTDTLQMVLDSADKYGAEIAIQTVRDMVEMRREVSS